MRVAVFEGKAIQERLAWAHETDTSTFLKEQEQTVPPLGQPSGVWEPNGSGHILESLPFRNPAVKTPSPI